MLSATLFLSCNSTGSGSGEEQPEEYRNEVGKESGTQFRLDEKYDDVRNGVRLILYFDKENSTFKGTVENITAKMIRKVRVEVHLSNRVELGPTTSVNLAPGEKQDVMLSAEGEKFDTWSTHAESGSNEHGHEGEEGDEHGGREHDKEGKGEHR